MLSTFNSCCLPYRIKSLICRLAWQPAQGNLAWQLCFLKVLRFSRLDSAKILQGTELLGASDNLLCVPAGTYLCKMEERPWKIRCTLARRRLEQSFLELLCFEESGLSVCLRKVFLRLDLICVNANFFQRALVEYWKSDYGVFEV